MIRKLFLLLVVSILFFDSRLLFITTVYGEEFDNIDSFNVHPKHRYENPLDTSDQTLTVNNGLLYYNDEGNSTDSSAYSRQLSKNDLKIEGRMKTPTVTEGYNDLFVDTDDIENNVSIHAKMDESSGTFVFNEMSVGGKYSNGTTVNTPTRGVDSFNYAANYAIDFERNQNEYIDFGDKTAYTYVSPLAQVEGRFEDQAFSICCWITCETLSGFQGLLAKYSGGIDREYALYLDSGRIRFALFSNKTSSRIARATDVGSLSNGDTAFVVATYDGSASSTGLDIYINGTIADTSSANSGTYYGMNNTVAPVEVGDWSSGNNFDGKIDEVILMGRELNQSFIQTMFNNYTHYEADVRTYIGVENVDTTLDLTVPAAAIGFRCISTSNQDDTVMVYYCFTDVNGVRQETNFHNLTQGIWVRFKISLDTFKSELEFEIEYDNGTGIDELEKDYLEISTTTIPVIFQADTLNVFYGNYFINHAILYWLFDFLDTDFEEFKWELSTSFLSNNIYYDFNELGARAEVKNDAIKVDSFKYEYNIPQLDSLSGVLYSSTNDSSLGSIDSLYSYVILQLKSIFAENGSTDHTFTIYFGHAGNYNFRIFSDTGINYYGNFSTFYDKMEMPFTFYINPDKIAVIQINVEGVVKSFSLDMSNSSSEFIVSTYYFSGTQDNNDDQGSEFFIGIREFEPIYRDLFGFVPDLGDVLPDDPVGAAVDGVKNIFTQGFRLLGSIMDGIGALLVVPLNLIKGVIDSIKIVIDTISSTLSTLLATADTIFTKVNAILVETADILIDTGLMVADIGSIWGVIEDLVSDLVTEFTTLLEDLPDILDDVIAMASILTTIVTDVANAIWTAIISQVSNIVDEIVTVLIAIVSDMVEIIETVVAFIWDNIIESNFGGITSFLERGINLLQQLVTLAEDGWNGMITFAPLVFILWNVYLFIFPAFTEDWYGGVADKLTADITQGISLLGFRIYVPAAFLWFSITLFYGFTWF
jgi:hypothetical protein